MSLEISLDARTLNPWQSSTGCGNPSATRCSATRASRLRARRTPASVRRRSRPSCGSSARPARGKTAIVAALTGDPRADIGEGFEPCTRAAAFYDVPSEAPLLRFLDTRGLGEADYDPAKDIAWCEGQSHLLLVAMQVDDPVQESVMRVLREA